MAVTLGKCFSAVSIYSAFKSALCPSTSLLSKTLSLQFSSGNPQTQETVPDYTKIEDEMCKEVFTKVNDQIRKKSYGRLFAVVHLQGTQFKITTEDLIVIRKSWPPTLGDKIRFEKVLLVGSADFTLIGRPLLPLDQVLVTGTVIEKTLTTTIHHLVHRRRKNYLKHKLYKDELTFVRINSIDLMGEVNELGDTDGLKGRIF